jgi:hypothetical protein
MMLVSEGNVSKEKKSKGTLLCRPSSIVPAGGLLLTLHNGIKVYFSKCMA